MRAFLLALPVLLAGCDATPPGPDGAEPPAGPSASTPPSLAGRCPERCGVLADLAQRNLGEPDAAVDPSDPQRLAVVAQAIQPGAVQGPLGVSLTRFVLFASADGGASWQPRDLPEVRSSPAPDIEQHVLSDPTVAFGAEGRLFVAGMVTSGPGWKPFVLASDDLGESWAEPRVFEEEQDADRPWLEADGSGSVVLAWLSYEVQDGRVEGGPAGWAWSMDNGAAWHQGTSPESPGCDIVQRPALDDKGATLVCWTQDGGRGWHWRDGSWQAGFELPAELVVRGVARAPDGDWFLESNTLHLLLRSPAGNVTDLRALLSVEDAWDYVFPKAFARDAGGVAHLLLQEIRRLPHGGFAPGQVAYVAVASVVVEERVVLDAPASTLLQGVGAIVDHFQDIALQREAGLAVWAGDGDVHWMVLGLGASGP